MAIIDVGVRIERARATAGLSQRALADMTGISQPTLSRVISGQRPAKMPELMAIAWRRESQSLNWPGQGRWLGGLSAWHALQTTRTWKACARRCCISLN